MFISSTKEAVEVPFWSIFKKYSNYLIFSSERPVEIPEINLWHAVTTPKVWYFTEISRECNKGCNICVSRCPVN